MITVYHLEKSRSIRIIWALEELGLDYKIEGFRRTKSFEAPLELKKIHALGKAPILKDGDNLLVESGAILEYLQSQYDLQYRFKPKPREQSDSINYIFWMHYTEGSLMPLLVFQLVTELAPSRAPVLLRFLVNKVMAQLRDGFVGVRLRDHVAYIEKFLHNNEYLAGNFSFADIQMQFALRNIQDRLPFLLSSSSITNYLARVEAREAYAISIEKEKTVFDRLG